LAAGERSDGRVPGSHGATLLDIPAERTVSVNEDAEWLRRHPQQEQEWIGQLSLIYSALIGIGVVMVQPFLTAASLDLSAKVCVVAFSVGIPLLAALVLVNQHEVVRRRVTKSVLVETARVVAQLCAFVGVVAGFWHILWIAGVGMLAGGLVAVAVHSVGYWRLERDRLVGLERDQKPTPQQGDEPGDTGS
jgi:O-antigen/teichoic acid export membrane protein